MEKSPVLPCSIPQFFSILHHEHTPLWWPSDMNWPELPEHSPQSLILYVSKCVHLISVEKVFFLLLSKFIFLSVPWIYLPSSSPCSIGHSFCYPGSLLPPAFLLGCLSIWQGVAQVAPPWGTLYSHRVPNILRALGIWGVCALVSPLQGKCPEGPSSILFVWGRSPGEWVKCIGGEWLAFKNC